MFSLFFFLGLNGCNLVYVFTFFCRLQNAEQIFSAALEQKNMQFLKISQASFCHLSFVKHENKVYGKTAKELA